MPYLYHQNEAFDEQKAASQIIESVLPELKRKNADQIAENQEAWLVFLKHLHQYLPKLIHLYFDIYSSCFNAYPMFLNLVKILAEDWLSRSSLLMKLDAEREKEGPWFQSNKMAGGIVYVDLYAGTLKKLKERIPYFKELGLNYIHLMPLFKTLDGDNDGGYAVSDYQNVNPSLGSIDDLRDLAEEFHKNGMVLCLDFVFNHTSSEHEWAMKAKAGDERYQNYYWMFDDRTVPDQYERTLREIFPDEHPGGFTWFPDIKKWVWTTFHSYQWDLNYQNPEVFLQMADQMLKLSNVGIDVLRLDAVAFIWKQMGTACESLPQAYELIDAFNLIARISAPSLIFKSEAIVHPDEVIRYIDSSRCQISYNPLLMALMWETMATRDTRLLNFSMRRRFKLPAGTAWVNYIRCHDDIGWTFSDEDAAQMGINAYPHRQFLNQFYTGRFPGSFAKGLPFQENPRTGDCRISGMMASLAGLEKSLIDGNKQDETFSIRRMLVMFGVIATIGGMPLIYLGDEIGTMNDYSYQSDPAKKNDSRWVHRCKFNEKLFEERNNPETDAGKIYQGVKKLLQLRKEHEVFSLPQMNVLESYNQYLFVYTKSNGKETALMIANFSEHEVVADRGIFNSFKIKKWTDLYSGKTYISDLFLIEPYQFICLCAPTE